MVQTRHRINDLQINQKNKGTPKTKGGKLNTYFEYEYVQNI